MDCDKNGHCSGCLPEARRNFLRRGKGSGGIDFRKRQEKTGEWRKREVVWFWDPQRHPAQRTAWTESPNRRTHDVGIESIRHLPAVATAEILITSDGGDP